MESWRERGFVPDSDSDSEDGFDSQAAKKLSKGEEENLEDPGGLENLEGTTA